jgi:hypothetical protein
MITVPDCKSGTAVDCLEQDGKDERIDKMGCTRK